MSEQLSPEFVELWLDLLKVELERPYRGMVLNDRERARAAFELSAKVVALSLGIEIKDLAWISWGAGTITALEYLNDEQGLRYLADGRNAVATAEHHYVGLGAI